MSKETATINILLVDDHRLMRVGLVTIIRRTGDMKVIAEAENGEEAVALAGRLRPHVVIMDVGMPIMDGIEAAKIIHAQYPDIRVLMLTSHDSEHDLFASFASGANGYCLKNAEPERLFSAIRSVHKGDIWMDSGIASKVLRSYSEPFESEHHRSVVMSEEVQSQPPPASPNTQFNPYEPLSSREKEVLALIVEGLNNQQIADRLFISIPTAKSHVRNILNKLAVDDRTQAAVLALKHGLVH